MNVESYVNLFSTSSAPNIRWINSIVELPFLSVNAKLRHSVLRLSPPSVTNDNAKREFCITDGIQHLEDNLTFQVLKICLASWTAYYIPKRSEGKLYFLYQLGSLIASLQCLPNKACPSPHLRNNANTITSLHRRNSVVLRTPCRHKDSISSAFCPPILPCA